MVGVTSPSRQEPPVEFGPLVAPSKTGPLETKHGILLVSNIWSLANGVRKIEFRLLRIRAFFPCQSVSQPCHCPSVFSTLLATFTPLSPLAYRATPR